MSEKNNILTKLKFKGSWRVYQKRVLDELDYHLDDSKLNVVAAPGAGKTTLGIEVLLRLGSPALILAPTVTIKNQWKQRILENFLSDNSYSNLISTDIKNISEITVSTYQGLHSLYKNKEEKEKFINDLKENNVQTLILDEAHHLRTEWWATLNNLYENLNNENFKIVSMTGTPPYDVSPSEWANYNSLCGSVDAEISVPELVKAGDLCPHQDLIYFSDLSEEEKNIVYAFEKRRSEFFKYINEKSDVLYAVQGSDFVNNLDKNVDIIYKNTNFTVSVISYLLSADSLSTEARVLAEFLDLSVEQIPKFDYEVAQTLFNGMLNQFKNHFKKIPIIKSKLKELKLVSCNRVDFTGKINFGKLFARSKNKLDAIYKITDFEYKNLKNNIREVILLDYVGKGDSEGLNIISVFEKIKNLNISIGILTGTLITVPKSAKQELYNILEKKNIEKTKVLTTEFEEEYIRVETYGNVDIVSVITELFSKGYLNILIGTAALLGEGWDSPCVNTLVIASTVGSFMLSNQMRGRALRINKRNPKKTSDIWHLVSLTDDYEKSPDYITVTKRFATFEGISYQDNKIQNGIERLGVNFNNISNLNCEKLNEKFFEFAKNRNDLPDKWKQVFKKSVINEKSLAPMIYDVMTSGENQFSIINPESKSSNKIVNSLIINCSTFKNNNKLSLPKKLLLKVFKEFKLLSDDYEGLIEQNRKTFEEQSKIINIAKALIKTMCDISVIKTDYKKINLVTNKELNSEFYMTVTGCTNYERNLFIKSFGEFFEINDNSRYILKKDEKYVSVPECIANHNKNVKIFVYYLEQTLGYFAAVYTRTPNGYKELLKAKYNRLRFNNVKHSRVWI